MDSYIQFFDIIALVGGLYILHTWFKLQKSGALFPNGLLIPGGKYPEDCRDQAAYIAYIKPRMLICGGIVALSSVMNLINAQLKIYGFWATEIITLLVLAVLIWYAVCSGKANRTYW